MPTMPQYKLPRGESPSEFEVIVLDVLKQIWNDPEAKLYGRNGQSQYGIDIIGTLHVDMVPEGTAVCQARHTEKVDWRKIEEEDLPAADVHFEDVKQFVVATSAPRSTGDQDRARALSAERQREGKCPVVVMSWNEIEACLLRDKDLLHAHYPDYKPEKKIVVKGRGVSTSGAVLLALGGLFFGSLIGSGGGDDHEDDDY